MRSRPRFWVSSDDRTHKAVETTQNRGRERIEQDGLHHVWAEELDRRNHHPRDRADRCCETPAEPEHPPDANPGEPRRVPVLSRGAKREAELRKTEKDAEQHDDCVEHSNHLEVLDL